MVQFVLYTEENKRRMWIDRLAYLERSRSELLFGRGPWATESYTDGWDTQELEWHREALMRATIIKHQIGSCYFTIHTLYCWWLYNSYWWTTVSISWSISGPMFMDLWFSSLNSFIDSSWSTLICSIDLSIRSILSITACRAVEHVNITLRYVHSAFDIMIYISHLFTL